MTHIFEPGWLEYGLHNFPSETLRDLLDAELIEIVRADFQGIAGPTWDIKRERFVLRIEIAVAPVTVDGLSEPPQQKELQAACPGSVNDGGAANPPAARTVSAAIPAEISSLKRSARSSARPSSKARSVAHTAES